MAYVILKYLPKGGGSPFPRFENKCNLEYASASLMNYCFFQKGRRKIPDLPSGSQARRAMPGEQALAQRGLTAREKANQYNASRLLEKIIHRIL